VTDRLPPEYEEKRPQLGAFLKELLEANTKFNLTAVRSAEDAWERHIIESALVAPLLGRPKSLLDVGTGGGLPGMVLAICRPEIAVTLLEATTKKARFLEATRDKLALSNVQVVCDRAESAAARGSTLRESFDVVTARAVAPLRVLLELTVPFAHVGGTIFAIKGEKAAQELEEAARAQRLLKASLLEDLEHPAGRILKFRKTAPTELGYPRRSGEPKRRPL
jgi:16S rRNA (guanine527-N7)-methyltransferase